MTALWAGKCSDNLPFSWVTLVSCVDSFSKNLIWKSSSDAIAAVSLTTFKAYPSDDLRYSGDYAHQFSLGNDRWKSTSQSPGKSIYIFSLFLVVCYSFGMIGLLYRTYRIIIHKFFSLSLSSHTRKTAIPFPPSFWQVTFIIVIVLIIIILLIESNLLFLSVLFFLLLKVEVIGQVWLFIAHPSLSRSHPVWRWIFSGHCFLQMNFSRFLNVVRCVFSRVATSNALLSRYDSRRTMLFGLVRWKGKKERCFPIFQMLLYQCTSVKTIPNSLT